MSDDDDRFISDGEIRDIALKAGFTVREQPDGEFDLNPYVYDFARTLIKRARGTLVAPERTAKAILVVKVDKQSGATREYDVSATPAEVCERWMSELALASDQTLLEEIVETPYMHAKVIVNSLDDQHVYMMIRGNELNEMGAGINALIDKRWNHVSQPLNALFTEDDMAHIHSLE